MAHSQSLGLHATILFSILAAVTGGNSYRYIMTFIKVQHRRRLNAAFGLHRRRARAHTSIRYILQASIRRRSSRFSCNTQLACKNAATDPARGVIAIDGKTVRRSFDSFNNRKAAQVLYAFDTAAGLVLAHIDIADNSNEIVATPIRHHLHVENTLHYTRAAAHAQRLPSRARQRLSERLSNDAAP